MEQSVIEGFQLSPQQRRAWGFERRHVRLYVQGLARVDGALEPIALGRSLERLIESHEVLRTTFRTLSGMELPIQSVAEDPCFELRTLCPTEGPDWSTLLREEREHGLDPEHGPLARFVLVELPDGRCALVVTLSPLVADPRSVDNLFRDLAKVYAEQIDGAREGERADEVVQYIDFSEWLNELLQEDEATEHREHWRRQDSQPLDLSIVQSGDSEAVATPEACEPSPASCSLSSELGEGIRRLAAEEDVTSEAVLLAVWQTFLWRLSRQPEIVVGCLAEGRRLEQLESALGPFARYLPVAVSLRFDFSGLEVIRAVAQAMEEGRRRQEYFLWDEYHAQNELPRDHFGALFDYRKTWGCLETEGWPFHFLAAPFVLEPSDLRLSVIAGHRQMDLELHKSPALMVYENPDRLLESFVTLLGHLIACPDRAIGSLGWLGPKDREQLVQWNQTRRELSWELPIHRRFEDVALRRSEVTAVAFNEDEIAYGELERRSNRLARLLRHRGFGVGHRALLALDRSVEQFVALLAVLKAGGHFIPFDPDQPRPRRDRMVQETARDGAGVLWFHDAEDAPMKEIPCLEIAQAERLAASLPDTPPPVDVPTTAPVYGIFTSGSQGWPKVPWICHRSVVNLIQALETVVYEPLGGPTLSRVAVNAPMTFDASVKQWGQLLEGRSLRIVPETVRGDGRALLEWLETWDIEVFDCTPSQLYILQEAGLLDAERAPGLKLVLLGGEAVGRDLWKRLAAQDQVVFFNVYGPTECTVDVTAERIDSGSEPNIGRPLPNVRVQLLDPGGWLVPLDVAGELGVSGDGLALGYLGDPVRTAERFLPHPESSVPGDRIYRTGDRARFLPDGRLQFFGRLDDQVKIRGARIELGEIESVLAEHSEVAEAVAVLREDQDRQRLVAYVVLRRLRESAVEVGKSEKQGVSGVELTEYVRERLPDYMVPTVAVLEEFPLTPRGKLDRRALPAPEELESFRSREVKPPRTPVEEVLVSVFAKVLSIEAVGGDDSFFDLGGHSLLATQVMSRVRDAFQVELPLRTLFERPTAQDLAGSVEEALRQGHRRRVPEIVSLEHVPGERPLSFAQRRLWFLDQMQPGNPAYNISKAVRTRGRLNPCLLRDVLGEIARRHEVLREKFIATDGQPVCELRPPRCPCVPIVDLTSLSTDRAEQVAREQMASESLRSFDLESDDLWRVRLVRLSGEEHLVLFTMHHIVSDAWSLGLLVEELSALYGFFHRGEPSSVPDLPVQYVDFAAWQRGYLQGDVLDSHLAFWRRYLAGDLPSLELPVDRPRSEAIDSKGAYQYFDLSPELADNLLDFARGEGVTLFMVLVAAFKVFLYHHAKQDDLIIGTDLANRNQAETEKLIGFFINMLPMRTDLSGNPTFRRVLGRVREGALNVYAYQDLPFERLVEEIRPERDHSDHSPLFRTVLVLQNAPIDRLELPGLTLDHETMRDKPVRFDLSLWITETDDGLSGYWAFKRDLFKNSTVEGFHEDFVAILNRTLEEPEIRIDDLEVTAGVHKRREREKANIQSLRQASRRRAGVNR